MDEIKNWQNVYHGSPQDNISEFVSDYFGSESGDQYGRGVYTTKDLDEATHFGKGKKMNMQPHVYNVQIPADEYLYDLDKPFQKQSKYIRDALVNWKQIPEKSKGEWIKMLLKNDGINNPINLLYGMEEHTGDVQKWLSEMGIHGSKVQPTGWGSVKGNLYRIIHNPTYAKIVDKLFGVMDPWSMSDMLKMSGNDPRAVFGSKKEKNKMLQEINEAGYTVERQPDGTLLFKI